MNFERTSISMLPQAGYEPAVGPSLPRAITCCPVIALAFPPTALQSVPSDSTSKLKPCCSRHANSAWYLFAGFFIAPQSAS